MTTLEHVASYFSLDLSRNLPTYDIRNTNRESLAAFFGYMDFKKGVEIGVERGEYSETLMKHLPKATAIYGIDPWLAYKGYREHVSQGKLDAFYAYTKERMVSYSAWRAVRQTSHQAATLFNDGELDFVYLDGNHDFFNVTRDLTVWTPKVRPGGIIAGHDFRRISTKGYNCHVVEVVVAWTQAFNIRPWFILGAKDKVDGELRDNSRSFFWVKS